MAVEAISTQALAASGSNVTGAIQKASTATGTSFEYMLATARVESRLNPNAAASTSSARGLYQFIEQTWLGTMKDAGPSLGYGRYADAITRQPSGRMTVSDPAMRSEILNLRNDPTANATMAGAFTQKNAERLQSKLGRPATNGELYIAHFLGAGGATRLITRAANEPNTIGANAFPGAARANRSVFYEKGGRARSSAEVYANLVGRYDVARGVTPTQAAKAATVQPANTIAATSAPTRVTVTPVERVAASMPVSPTTASATNAAAPANALPPGAMAYDSVANDTARKLSPSDPVFHSMFRAEDRPGGVSRFVHDLWSPSTYASASAQTATAVDPVTKTATAPAADIDSVALDLFRNQVRDVRGLFGSRT